MDQKFKFGGNIGYGIFILFLFCQFKVFTLHAILHDAAGAVRAHSDKGPGYCYMIGRGPESCLLVHETWLLFCLYVKLFLPSNFNSADFRSSMSWIVLDIELAEKNVNKELGVYIDGKIQGYSFRPPKKYKPTKQAFWSSSNLHGIVWNSGRLHYSEFSKFLPRAVKVITFQKEQKKERFLSFYWIKRWKIWKTTAVPKFKISLLMKLGIAPVTHSNTRPQFTVQSVKQNCSLTGYCDI